MVKKLLDKVKEITSNLNIHELKIVARRIGISSPTACKRSELETKICQALVTNERNPLERKVGRRPKMGNIELAVNQIEEIFGLNDEKPLKKEKEDKNLPKNFGICECVQQIKAILKTNDDFEVVAAIIDLLQKNKADKT